MKSLIKSFISLVILMFTISIVNNNNTHIDPLEPSDYNKVAIYVKDKSVYKPFVIETGSIEYGILNDEFNGTINDPLLVLSIYLSLISCMIMFKMVITNMITPSISSDQMLNAPLPPPLDQPLDVSPPPSFDDQDNVVAPSDPLLIQHDEHTPQIDTPPPSLSTPTIRIIKGWSSSIIIITTTKTNNNNNDNIIIIKPNNNKNNNNKYNK